MSEKILLGEERAERRDMDILHSTPGPTTAEANRSLGEAMGLLGVWLDLAQGGYGDGEALDMITLSVATREFLARARKETGDG